MAASPPPYPPQTPPSQDPREQQKAYWRAQKDAFRTQRDYWRAQRRDQRYYWRSMHRPSIVGPIVLLELRSGRPARYLGQIERSLLLGLVHPLVADVAGSGSAWFLCWSGFSIATSLTAARSAAFGIVLLVFILVGIAYSQRHVGDWSRQIGHGDPGDWTNLHGRGTRP